MRFADAPQGQLRFNCLRVPVFDPGQYAVGRLRNKVVAGNARQLQFASSGLLLGRAESKYQKWLACFGHSLEMALD
jgi:hypothetical protein